METKSEILDVAEIAKRLQITSRTAYEMTRTGKIPSFRVGGSIRYDWNDVLATLKQTGAEVTAG